MYNFVHGDDTRIVLKRIYLETSVTQLSSSSPSSSVPAIKFTSVDQLDKAKSTKGRRSTKLQSDETRDIMIRMHRLQQARDEYIRGRCIEFRRQAIEHGSIRWPLVDRQNVALLVKHHPQHLIEFPPSDQVVRLGNGLLSRRTPFWHQVDSDRSSSSYETTLRRLTTTLQQRDHLQFSSLAHAQSQCKLLSAQLPDYYVGQPLLVRCERPGSLLETKRLSKKNDGLTTRDLHQIKQWTVCSVVSIDNDDDDEEDLSKWVLELDFPGLKKNLHVQLSDVECRRLSRPLLIAPSSSLQWPSAQLGFETSCGHCFALSDSAGATTEISSSEDVRIDAFRTASISSDSISAFTAMLASTHFTLPQPRLSLVKLFLRLVEGLTFRSKSTRLASCLGDLLQLSPALAIDQRLLIVRVFGRRV